MTPCERLDLAIHMESAAIAPQTSELIEAAKEVRRENETMREALARAAIWLECDGLHSRADEMRAICQQIIPEK